MNEKPPIRIRSHSSILKQRHVVGKLLFDMESSQELFGFFFREIVLFSESVQNQREDLPKNEGLLRNPAHFLKQASACRLNHRFSFRIFRRLFLNRCRCVLECFLCDFLDGHISRDFFVMRMLCVPGLESAIPHGYALVFSSGSDN